MRYPAEHEAWVPSRVKAADDQHALGLKDEVDEIRKALHGSASNTAMGYRKETRRAGNGSQTFVDARPELGPKTGPLLFIPDLGLAKVPLREGPNGDR
jgi:hypothetical protein